MFSLIIAVVAIALVVALVAASGYYGGSGISEAQAQADAARLKNEEQQILGAVDMFNADKGRWPADVQELVSSGYLVTVPRGVELIAAVGPDSAMSTVLSSAYAATDGTGWGTPVVGQPVFQTADQVPELTCAKYNLITRGDDGILKQAYTNLSSQCFGVDGDYRVVISKQAAGVSSLTSILGGQALEGALPAKSGDVFWAKPPTGEVKVATDPEKTPFAHLALSSGDLNFGGVEVGSNATGAQRALVNDGNIAATGVSITAPEGFSLVGNSCGGTIGPNASCSFSLSFSPTQAQPYAGSVQVSSANGGSQAFNVRGQGQQALLDVAPSVVGFAPTQTGQASSSSAITVSNPGSSAITGLAITAPAGFSIATSTCGSSLPVGSSCAFHVKFEPTQTKAYSGQVQVFTANAGSKTVAVAETSVDQQGSLSAVSFGDVVIGSSKNATSTLTNTGVGPLTMTAPTAGSITGADFSFVGTNCSSPLAVGASCTVTAKYTPSTNAAASGLLTLATGAGSKTAALAGNGLGSIAVLTSPASVTLSDWHQAGAITTSIGYRNDGEAPMTLSSPTLTTPLSAVGNTCTNVAPGASCAITVALTRNANNGGSGSQSFTAVGGSAAPSSVTVNWSIYSVIASWSQAYMAFNTVTIGQASTKNFTLTNSGSVAANWTSLVGLPAGFSADMSACGNVPPAGGSCSVTITFAPTAEGYVTGDISDVKTSSWVINFLTVYGTGQGQATLSVSPTYIDFGTVKAGFSTGVEEVWVSNTSSYAATGITASASNWFGVAYNQCPASLAPGQGCIIGFAASSSYVTTMTGSGTIKAANSAAVTVNMRVQATP